MKTFLAWTLVVVAVVALGIGALAHYGRQADQESKAYVDEVVPLIVASWDWKGLVDHASPELLTIAPPEQLSGLFNALSQKLGPMKSYSGSKGQANMMLTSKGRKLNASYICQVEFANGPGQISIGVTKENDHWQVAQFYVNSPLLMPQ